MYLPVHQVMILNEGIGSGLNRLRSEYGRDKAQDRSSSQPSCPCVELQTAERVLSCADMNTQGGIK